MRAGVFSFVFMLLQPGCLRETNEHLESMDKNSEKIASAAEEANKERLKALTEELAQMKESIKKLVDTVSDPELKGPLIKLMNKLLDAADNINEVFKEAKEAKEEKEAKDKKTEANPPKTTSDSQGPFDGIKSSPKSQPQEEGSCDQKQQTEHSEDLCSESMGSDDDLIKVPALIQAPSYKNKAQPSTIDLQQRDLSE